MDECRTIATGGFSCQTGPAKSGLARRRPSTRRPAAGGQLRGTGCNRRLRPTSSCSPIRRRQRRPRSRTAAWRAVRLRRRRPAQHAATWRTHRPHWPPAGFEAGAWPDHDAGQAGHRHHAIAATPAAAWPAGPKKAADSRWHVFRLVRSVRSLHIPSIHSALVYILFLKRKGHILMRFRYVAPRIPHGLASSLSSLVVIWSSLRLDALKLLLSVRSTHCRHVVSISAIFLK